MPRIVHPNLGEAQTLFCKAIDAVPELGGDADQVGAFWGGGGGGGAEGGPWGAVWGSVPPPRPQSEAAGLRDTGTPIARRKKVGAVFRRVRCP